MSNKQNDIWNENLQEYKLQEQERILGIIDDYNVGGQLDWLIEKIKI